VRLRTVGRPVSKGSRGGRPTGCPEGRSLWRRAAYDEEVTPTPEVPDAASALPPERGVNADADPAAGAAAGAPHFGSAGAEGRTGGRGGGGPAGPHGRVVLFVLLAVLLTLVGTVSALLPGGRDSAPTALPPGPRPTISTHSVPTTSPSAGSAGSPASSSGPDQGAGPAGSTTADSARDGRASAARAAPGSATLRRGDGRPERVHALTALLATRRRAVLQGDLARWLDTVDSASPAFRNRQAEVFANLGDVPFSDWSYRYVGPAPSLSAARARELGGNAWVARVLVGHRLREFDTATSYSEQFLTVVHRSSGWRLAADNDGSGAPQPWDLGKVRVVRGAHVLALGTGSTADLRSYALVADRAVAEVTSVWGAGWPRRAVLVVPRTQAEFGRLLLRDPRGLSQVAAVTTGDLTDDGPQSPTDRSAGDPTSSPTSPSDRGAQVAPATGSEAAPPVLRRNDRVVLNPGAFDRLGPTGRRVVLTHEMTHVAVRSSTTAAVPIWLSEGTADYVAYKDSGVPLRTAAADVLGLVRRGAGPTSLPTTGDFDPTRTSIAPAYSAAMLACAMLVERYGEAALVRVYQMAATRSNVAQETPDARLSRAFTSVLGTTARRFTVDWHRYLVRMAE
jgi:hypothetical protein